MNFQLNCLKYLNIPSINTKILRTVHEISYSIMDFQFSNKAS